MSDQPKALWLADALDNLYVNGLKGGAATELRRLHKVEAERDALKELLDDYTDDYKAVVNEQCAGDEVHCSCVPHLRKRIKEVEAERDALHGKVERLAAEVANRNRRALDGDEAVAGLAKVHAYYEGIEAERDAAVAVLETVLRIPSMSDADLEQLRINCKAAIDAAKGDK